MSRRSSTVSRQLVKNMSPGLPSGRLARSSFIIMCPCTRLLSALTSGTPASAKSSAIVRPESFCLDHISGGAKVASIRSPGSVRSSMARAASRTMSPLFAYSRYI